MYFFKYIRFLFIATNHHGVHSPFVYAFVTKCLYNKNKYSNKKRINIVLKIIAYFNISEINLKHQNSILEQHILSNFPKILYNEKSNSLIFFDILDNEVLSFIDNSKMDNKTIIFINNIYKHKKAWQSLIKKEKVTVSVDLFYCGVLFFRREQVKEDFKIRI